MQKDQLDCLQDGGDLICKKTTSLSMSLQTYISSQSPPPRARDMTSTTSRTLTQDRSSSVATSHTDCSRQLEQTTSNRERRFRRCLGLRPDAPVKEDHNKAPHQELLWSKIRCCLREPLAEFFGMFIMMLIGNGSVAQVLLSTGQKDAPGGNGYGSYQSICWGCVPLFDVGRREYFC